MKKDRNCGGMYQGYANAIPVMGSPVMMPPMGNAYMPNQVPYQGQQTYTQPYNSIEKELNDIHEQINSLSNRVSKLESKGATYNTKYSDSNYYML